VRITEFGSRGLHGWPYYESTVVILPGIFLILLIKKYKKMCIFFPIIIKYAIKTLGLLAIVPFYTALDELCTNSMVIDMKMCKKL
jgi:hypothetical protein